MFPFTGFHVGYIFFDPQPCFEYSCLGLAKAYLSDGVSEDLGSRIDQGAAAQQKLRTEMDALEAKGFCGFRKKWVWVKIKPPGFGLQVVGCSFHGQTISGVPMLTHSEICINQPLSGTPNTIPHSESTF